MIRYRYAMNWTPPAPLVHVTLRHPTKTHSSQELLALVDTGADRTVIPLEFAQALELDSTGEVFAMGLGKEIVSIPTFGLLVAIRQMEPVLTNAFAHADEQFILLGRDVLNRFNVHLLGRESALEMG